MKKEAWDTETTVSANIPDWLHAESQAYSSAWPQLPALRQPGGQASWPARSTSLVQGGNSPEERTLKNICRSWEAGHGIGIELIFSSELKTYLATNFYSFFYNVFTESTEKNTLQIRSSKRGAKRSTWLFGYGLKKLPGCVISLCW